MIEIKTKLVDDILVPDCEEFPPTPFGKALAGDKWFVFENQEEVINYYSNSELETESTLEGSTVLSMVSKMSESEINALRNLLNP